MRVCGDGLSQILGQIKRIAQSPDAFRPDIGGNAENVRDEVQVPDAGHEVIQIGVVGDVCQLPLACQRILPDGGPADGYLAFVKRQDAGYSLQGGGLAGSVVPDEAADLAGGNVQRQVIHCLFVSVGFGQMGNCQHMRHFLSYCVLCPCGRFWFV